MPFGRRVLCLHAYGGNAQDFEARTKQLRAPFKDVDWHYMEAPIETTGGRVWWSYPEWDAAVDPIGYLKATHYDGLPELLALVAEEEERGGAFTGVLGFSQGAVAAATLCARERSALRWAVLISGFAPRDPRASFGAQLHVPTLHVIGTADAVAPEATRALAQHFVAAESVEHDKGHVAQLPAEARQRVVDFLHRHLDAPCAVYT